MKSYIAGWGALCISHVYMLSGDDGVDMAFCIVWMCISAFNFWMSRP